MGEGQSQGKLVWKGQKNCSPLLLTHETYKLIHIWLWNFKDGGSWKAIFLAKNQHIERKLFFKYPLMNYGLSNFRYQKSIISSRTLVAKALIVLIMLVGQDMFFLPISFIFQNHIFQIIASNPVKLFFQKKSQFSNLLKLDF